MLPKKMFGECRAVLLVLFTIVSAVVMSGEAEARGGGWDPRRIVLNIALQLFGEAIVRGPNQAEAAPQQSRQPTHGQSGKIDWSTSGWVNDDWASDWGDDWLSSWGSGGGGYYDANIAAWSQPQHQVRCGPWYVVFVEYIPTYNGYITRNHYERMCY